MNISKKQQPIIIGLAILAMVLLGSGQFFDISGMSYVNNSDTVLSTGIINVDTPSNSFYLTNQNNILVSGTTTTYANASGTVYVQLSTANKFCQYSLTKSNDLSNLLYETWVPHSVINNITYNAKITLADGSVITRNGLSPFDRGETPIELPRNSAYPSKQVILKLQPQEASLGSTNCADPSAFRVIKQGSNIIMQRSDKLAIPDVLDALAIPNSLNRIEFDKVKDTSLFSQSIIKYNMISIGTAQVKVTVPFFAYNVILWQKTPEGRAEVQSCSVAKASSGKSTYMTLKYKNIGETSLFSYVVSGSDFSSAISNSGSVVANGATRTEIIPISLGLGTSNPPVAIIAIKGQSGITITSNCLGERAAGDNYIPPIPPTPDTNDTIECGLFQKKYSAAEGGWNIPIIGNAGGTQVISCEWDIVPLATIVILAGLFVFGVFGTSAIVLLSRRK